MRFFRRFMLFFQYICKLYHWLLCKCCIQLLYLLILPLPLPLTSSMSSTNISTQSSSVDQEHLHKQASCVHTIQMVYARLSFLYMVSYLFPSLYLIHLLSILLINGLIENIVNNWGPNLGIPKNQLYEDC